MSEGFSADWLALREPADHAARNADLRARFIAALPARPRLTDLGSGTGSTLRALAPHVDARWTLVDADAGLLARAQSRHDVGIRPANLQQDLEAVLDLPAHGITTSAFLDIVSADWLRRFAALCAARRLPFYAALTVDGHLAAEPSHRDDAAMFAAFNRHMRRDKGLGGALGPDAARVAAETFRAQGHVVELARADWRLGPSRAELQHHLLAGWATAIAELDDAPAGLVAWTAARHAAIDAGTSRLTVGHLDLLALPPP